ncbi:MAG: hypothetical protein IJ770_03650 [Alphaproteobacteria bacterium]|nr:hypothetical protein [Alphaproteobacteria bacterium]
MEYSRFDDVAALLIELCKPMNDKELVDLMNVKISMMQNKDFEKHYTAAVKGLYVKHFQELKNKTYQPQNFSVVNSNLITGLKNKTAEIGLLPAYTKTDNTLDSPAIAGLRAKIAKLRAK